MNYFTFERHFIIFNSFGNFTNSSKLMSKSYAKFL